MPSRSRSTAGKKARVSTSMVPNNVTDLWHVKKVSPQQMDPFDRKKRRTRRPRHHLLVQARENVLDLFGGSCSTLIACKQVGRRAFLMELDAAHTDVLVQRWESFTGKKSELA